MLSTGVRPAAHGVHRSLAAVPVFRRLMPVFALSDLGDGAVSVAVVWLALALGGAGLAGLAGVLMCCPAPSGRSCSGGGCGR